MSQVMNATVKGMVNSLQEEAYGYFFFLPLHFVEKALIPDLRRECKYTYVAQN